MLSVLILAFLGGTITSHFQVFPYPNIRDATKTLQSLVSTFKASSRSNAQRRIEPTHILASEAPTSRLTTFDVSFPRLPMIASGGLNQYLEHCPQDGCLAVALSEDGAVSETWPYRPIEIYNADITDGRYPHETSLNFDPITHVYPTSVQRYANGDILVNFQSSGGVFPFGMGVTRVAGDGKPRWTRFDYSHHWSTLTANGIAYTPSLKIGQENVRFSFGAEPSPETYDLACETGRPQLDTIQRIDGNGALLEEIDLIPILIDSNFAGILPETSNPCDPLHLNYIDQIRSDAEAGLAKGDLVLSFRNLSRFAIFDPKKKVIKRLVTGGFVQQHSVHHLSGSKFLLFDNRGGDAFGPGSRIVEVDIASGTERRIFPNTTTPQPFAEVFSDRAGHLDISPDRTRVLASFTHAGRSFEIDIESGQLLAMYDSLHDVSTANDVSDDEKGLAWRFSIYSMTYVSQ
ncbi:MAG: arylsulfotransferase family protein [Geminicoccaceae bacterium]